jgi:hypothetical protein
MRIGIDTEMQLAPTPARTDSVFLTANHRWLRSPRERRLNTTEATQGAIGDVSLGHWAETYRHADSARV